MLDNDAVSLCPGSDATRYCIQLHSVLQPATKARGRGNTIKRWDASCNLGKRLLPHPNAQPKQKSNNIPRAFTKQLYAVGKYDNRHAISRILCLIVSCLMPHVSCPSPGSCDSIRYVIQNRGEQRGHRLPLVLAARLVDQTGSRVLVLLAKWTNRYNQHNKQIGCTKKSAHFGCFASWSAWTRKL